ncbi:MAG: acyl-CoA reductase [Bacteroidota bacterium]|nr:acyl-CoA reductase [Bacteroidota bacterium]
MNLEERITIMGKLGRYLMENDDKLNKVKQKAYQKNKWFTEEFINYSFKNISENYLDEQILKNWVSYYHIDDNIQSQNIGVVMAGNIPLVGFHDFLSVFITGHQQLIKLSDKDDVLLAHIIDKLKEWNPKVSSLIMTSELLKDCDAFIATGSNNSARYFHHYFGKYPSVIRNNKTSVAVLSGDETREQLSSLADDVYFYFGLGCRNVTKLFVPENYNFEMLLSAFKKYDYFADLTKYRNNYDYNLALLIMNNNYYMANESIILSENENIFSPVSVLHYSFYPNENNLFEQLKNDENIQCIVGKGYVPFGKAQRPRIFDYADGIDTMEFLLSL